MNGERYRIKDSVPCSRCRGGERMFRIAGILLLLILFRLIFLPLTIRAEEMPQTVHVYDQAELLTGDEREQLETLCLKTGENRGIHILLITASDTEGKTPEEYADDFYDDVYPEEKDENGIAVLIDLGNRKLWISTAGIMRYYLSDREVERMLDHMYEYAEHADYAEALKAAVSDADAAAERGISSGDYLVDENGRVHRLHRITPMEGMIAAAAGVLVFCLVYFGVIRSYRRKGNPDPYGYARTGDMNLTERKDFLVDRHVAVRRIPKNPPPGNGGGQSTVHTSSSGRSHGGGGRSF